MFLLVTIIISSFSFYNYFIYPVFLNKLNKQKIPGPLHLKLSSLFILNIFRKEQGIEYLDTLHKKYGPIVQIGPNEVSFNDLDSVKKIYLYGNFPKEYSTPKSFERKKGFYSQFGNFNERNLFSTGDTKLHLTKKKPLQKIYSKSNVLNQRDFIQSKIDNLVQVLLTAKGKPVEVYSLFCSLAMDVVSGFEYGFQNSTDFLKDIQYSSYDSQDLKVEKTVFYSFRDSSSLWFYTTMFPRLYNFIVKIYNMDDSLQIGRTWIWQHLQKSIEKLTQQDLDDPKYVLSTLYNNYNKDLPKIGSEIADHVLAGHETTGVTLSYITWQLSRPANQHWQDKLFNEIQNNGKLCNSSFAGNKETPDYHELDQNCPVVHAIVQEACRLHAAIPGSERRFVPYGEPLKYQKFVIPPSTVVSCQPYSMNKITSVFGRNPNDFKPERWLKHAQESDIDYKQRIKEMERHMMTFGQGNRMCLGMHVALIDMKSCVAAIYGHPDLKKTRISRKWCETIVDNDSSSIIGYKGLHIKHKNDNLSEYKKLSDQDKMRMADTYTTKLMFDECWLTFQ